MLVVGFVLVLFVGGTMWVALDRRPGARVAAVDMQLVGVALIVIRAAWSARMGLAQLRNAGWHSPECWPAAVAGADATQGAVNGSVLCFVAACICLAVLALLPRASAQPAPASRVTKSAEG